MSVVTRTRIVGEPVDRIDGSLKVAGAAPYPTDISLPGLVHASLVQSAVAAGTIRRIDAAQALAAPGVLAVITHENAPPLAPAPPTPFGTAPRFPLQDERIIHYGQHVAAVVAQTPQQATAAARLVRVDYEAAPPLLDIDDPRAPVVENPYGLDMHRGDVASALASADVTYDATFITPAETNNPLGLFATVAHWTDGRLVVHEATQSPVLARQNLATFFGIAETDVRVLVPYLGGGFGAGLRLPPHAVITALAARMLDRPVKLVLTRPQMFTSIGHRPHTVQRIQLGMSRDGQLLVIDHEGSATVGIEETNREAITRVTPQAYRCPNIATRDRLVRLNIPNPGWMRAPGTVEGNFALESALDELSYQLGLDPLELRLRNDAEVHPPSGRPWSSRALRECYRVGAERFGWQPGIRGPARCATATHWSASAWPA